MLRAAGAPEARRGGGRSTLAGWWAWSRGLGGPGAGQDAHDPRTQAQAQGAPNPEPERRPREVSLRQALGTSPGLAGAPRLPAPHQAGSCLREPARHVY